MLLRRIDLSINVRTSSGKGITYETSICRTNWFGFREVGEGESICKLDVNEKLFNPQNVVHGGVLYSLADTSMGGALYPLLENGDYCATIEIKISYFKPVREGVLKCSTALINKGKTLACLESEVYNNGVVVAKASGSYSIFSPKTH